MQEKKSKQKNNNQKNKKRNHTGIYKLKDIQEKEVL